MKTELSVLNKRRKTNGIKRRKVVQGNPEVTGTWGKGLAPSGAAECCTYHVLNDATCVQDYCGNAENTVRDTLRLIFLKCILYPCICYPYKIRFLA